MPIRSQLRLEQLTGSLDDGVAAGSAYPIAHTSLQGSLDQLAAAVQRTHMNPDGFTQNLAGTFYGAIKPNAAGAQDIGTATQEWGDVYIADDKKIQLGSDQDFTMEYDENGADVAQFAGANIRLGEGGTQELQFRDADLKIHSPADGALSLDADSRAQVVSPDVLLATDNVVLSFGDTAGDRAMLSHVAAKDALRLTSAGPIPQLEIRDADLSIGSDVDGQLDLKADVEIELTAPLVEFSGILKVAGDIVSGSVDKNLLFGAATGMGGASGKDVAVAGDLQVQGNDIKSSTGATAITLQKGNVIIPGDLTVQGATTSIDTTNLEVEDKIIGMNYTSGSAAGALADAGLLVGNSGGSQRAWYYDNGSSRWAAVETNDNPDATSITPTAFLDVDVKDIHLQGLNVFGDGSGAAIILTTGNSPDVGIENHLMLKDDKEIRFGDATDNAAIKYDEAGTDALQFDTTGASPRPFIFAIDANEKLRIEDAHVELQGNGGRAKLRSAASDILILSSSDTRDFEIASGRDLFFTDAKREGSSWGNVKGIALSNASSDWSAFETAFGGEVSLLRGIADAVAGGAAVQKKTVEGSSGGATNAELNLDLSTLMASGGDAEVSKRVDIFVNGQLMVSASAVSGNGDYALDFADGTNSVDVTFQFNLDPTDVVTGLVR